MRYFYLRVSKVRFKRINGDISNPKDSLSPPDLKHMFSSVDMTDPFQALIWLIILLAFRTLLRKSHFVATSDHDHEHLLIKGDVSFHPWGCKITVNSSKTIQFHERNFEIPVYFSRHPFFTATLLQSYLHNVNKADSDWLFTTPKEDPCSPVSYTVALLWLKTWANLAGINKDIGFHSLRRGSASHMHSLNISLISIQKAGDWQSLCVLDYLSVDFAHKRKVEELVSLLL